MAVDQSYVDFLLDQLSGMGELHVRKMFGGAGFYHEGIMFGLLAKNVFHLRVDDSNRADYEAHGMKGYLASEKKKGMPYFEVPQHVIEDRDVLVKWSMIAHAIAVAAKK